MTVYDKIDFLIKAIIICIFILIMYPVLLRITLNIISENKKGEQQNGSQKKKESC